MIFIEILKFEIMKKIFTPFFGSLLAVCFLSNCAPVSVNGASSDPHDRLSSFGERVVLGAAHGFVGYSDPTVQNPIIDSNEPDNGGMKMTDRSRDLGKQKRHSIAPVGDYDFSFIKAAGVHAVQVSPKGGSVRVRVWQRASQISGPSTLVKDAIVASGKSVGAIAKLTPQQGFLVTRVEGTQGKRLVYDITYGRWGR